MRVLVVNAGSSSLKLARARRTTGSSTPPRSSAGTASSTSSRCGSSSTPRGRRRRGRPPGGARRPAAHRARSASTTTLLDYLDSIEDLAPLHNPRAVAAIRGVAPAAAGPAGGGVLRHRLPRHTCRRGRPHLRAAPGVEPALVGCAATASTASPTRTPYGGRRSWSARTPRDLRVVSLPPGRRRVAGGACAGGRSVDTTMGFTPLEGLVMATRLRRRSTRACCCGCSSTAGSTWPTLGRRARARVRAEGALRRRPATCATCSRHGAGDDDAALAFDVFVHRVRREVGAMTASAGGLDVARDHRRHRRARPRRAPRRRQPPRPPRARCRPGRNEAAHADADVTAAGATARTVVVTASEETEVARQVTQLLRG